MLLDPPTQTVCGLLFTTENNPRIVLARRNINGVPMYDGLGGELVPDARMTGQQIQLSEYVIAETGILTRPEDWTLILSLRADKWETHFFFLFSKGTSFSLSQGNTKQDDISFENPDLLPSNIVQSLKWLIPLVLDDTVNKPLGLAGVPL